MMKSLVMKSLYTSLGLLGSGKQSVEHLARQLAKKAELSEHDGKKIAEQLSHQSEQAIHAIQQKLNFEVNKVVKAIHVATKSARKKPSPAKMTKSTKLAKKHTG
jgi:polyhydroxyalkanoate synthesis regulator phasin